MEARDAFSSLRYNLFKYKLNYVHYIVKTDLSRFLDRTEPQKTAENRFIVVSVRFYEISKILGPVSVLVHPKSEKIPERTGPLNPIQAAACRFLCLASHREKRS